jgi:hypothetical protein
MAKFVRVSARRTLAAAALMLLPAMLASGCASSSGTPSPTTTAGASVVAPSPSTVPLAATPTPTPVAQSPTAAAAGSLTGSWSGTYDGAYTGTFALTWTEASNKLTGTIDLSTSGKVPLNGTVNGSAITFGTVGSTAITYTGTVSGDSMSGTYEVAGSEHGTWKANRTS